MTSLYQQIRGSNQPPILPLKSTNSIPHVSIPKRYSRALGGILLVAVITAVFLYWPSITGDSSLPPLFQKYHAAERKYPQHDESLPFPEGKHAKFIHFQNHQKGVGWGNVLQEMIFDAHLAFELRRSFIFDNYTWDRYGDYTKDLNGKIIPSRWPLSILIDGPLMGKSFGPEYPDMPRAISEEWFRKVCPNPTILRNDMDESINVQQGPKLLPAWFEKLKVMEDRCLQLEEYTRPIFDFMVFGARNIVEMWPIFSQSPILTKFAWPPFVTNMYAINQKLFEPKSWSSRKKLPDASATPMVDGLMAVHIRRGDFEKHCDGLAGWQSSFNGYTFFDSLPDKWEAPSQDNPEYNQIYKNRCFPEIDTLVLRILEVRKLRSSLGLPLTRLYIMTNGKPDWIAQLKEAIQEAGPGQFDSITSSRDLKLDREQKYAAQALDMYVAVRAQTFIGNGFSSLTSNIVMFRMLKKRDPLDTRFW